MYQFSLAEEENRHQAGLATESAAHVEAAKVGAFFENNHNWLRGVIGWLCHCSKIELKPKICALAMLPLRAAIVAEKLWMAVQLARVNVSFLAREAVTKL
jgi:hypothetical protein